MLENQIMEFVESVEPDFRYQGTEGMMNIVTESAENMILMESAINKTEYVAFQEGMIGSFADAIWSRIKKFFNWILGIIKKVIAKIKAFFMAIRRKLTMAAAAALRKIGDTIRSNVNMDKQGGDGESIEYKAINTGNVDKICANLKNIYKDIGVSSKLAEANKKAKDMLKGWRNSGTDDDTEDSQLKSSISTFKEKVEDDITDIIDKDKKDYLNKILEGITEFYKDGEKDTDNLVTTVKSACLKEESIVPSKEAFNTAYNKAIIKSIDKAYKAAMELYSKQISSTSEEEKNQKATISDMVNSINLKLNTSQGHDEKGKFTGKNKEYSEDFINKAKKGQLKSLVNWLLSVNLKYFNSKITQQHMIAAKTAQGIASASMASYKSLLAAVLKGVGRRTTYSKNESVEYNFL